MCQVMYNEFDDRMDGLDEVCCGMMGKAALDCSRGVSKGLHF